MFPHHRDFTQVDAGHILSVSGNDYVVVKRLPEAFHVRGLDFGGVEEVLDFAELAVVHAEGMLRIERPATKTDRAGSGIASLWLVIVTTYLRLVQEGVADRRDATILAVMPRLVDAQVRHIEKARQTGGPAGDLYPIHPSPADVRTRAARFRDRGSVTLIPERPPVRDRLESFGPVVAELTREVAFAYLSPYRPTARHLHATLVRRIADINADRDGSSGFLSTPSYSTFVRVVGSLPSEARERARHGATAPARLRPEARTRAA